MRQNFQITRRQFWGALFVCLALLASGNLAVQRMTAHTISRRLLAETREATHTQIIALGNSLMRSGFVPETFAPSASPQEKSSAFNLAMGASTPVEQLLLFRAGLQSFTSPRLLLYGFYDFQLTDPISFANSDIIGNHDILYYQEPRFARRYYQMNRYDAAAFEVDRRASLLAERGAVWAKVELLRRSLGQQGMPAQSSNQFGRAADFTLLEAKNREEFEQHCAAASRTRLNGPVAEMIREAQEKGIQVVFVVMPLPPKHVLAFYDSAGWNAYQQHIRRLLAAQDVAYLDASRWIPDASKFGDALHLTPAGAEEFSRRLGELCSNLNDLSSCSSPEK
jgi:hypothetical protein